MNKSETSWCIEARAFKIAYTPFTHNFWVLVDQKKKIVEQIHGLAVNPITGLTKAVGCSSDLLQVVHGSNILWSIQENQPKVSCITNDTKRVWQAALKSIPEINSLRLPYPDLWQHFYCMNSNTIFNTIGQIMGVIKPANLLCTLAPGVRRVISQDIIEKYRYSSDK
ncbi:hypothetical protein [Dendrosporobacter sp. 1207_IL3150]|uniref:hypothetical protein n=1 Tax=Dendrosporobacter sp. 1207_IL3150 TaxID=3084054 RepID=UPI002FD93469